MNSGMAAAYWENGILAGPEDVEIAQADGGQPVGHGEGLEVLLADPLADGVRRQRLALDALDLGQVRARRRRRRTRGEDQPPDARPSAAAQSMLSVPRMLISLVVKGSSTERGTDGRAAWWKTTSTPSTARRQVSRSRMSPSTSSIRPRPDGPGSRASRSGNCPGRGRRWPRRTSSSARCEPMKPAPPVTR